MNLERIKSVVKQLNELFDSCAMSPDFSQKLDQLLAEFDAARRPSSMRFMRSSHRPPPER